MLYQKSGDIDNALGNYRDALTVDADNFVARYNLGLIYMGQQKHAEAAGELEKALQQLEQGKEEEQKKGNAEQGQESSESKGQKEQQAPEEGEEEQSSQAASQKEYVSSGESPEDIINEEIKSRKYRRSNGATGYKPVDKDW